MNKFYIRKKAIIGVLAAVIFIAFVATVFCTSNSVALATSVDSEEIFYGATAYGETTGNVTNDVEEFEYATKQTTLANANPSYPYYYNFNNNLSNVCAPVAGASLIGFYDRFYEDLIPNSTPGVVRRNIYTYYECDVDNDVKQAVINTLFTDMGTNTISPGTSQAQYKSGLTTFVNRKNMNITYTSVMTNGNLDANKVVAQLNAGRPITLYLQGYNLTTVQDRDNKVTAIKVIYTTNHIMIAYGYEKEDYYDANGALIKSKIYLYISTGMMGVTGVYVVDNNGILNDAEAVNIF